MKRLISNLFCQIGQQSFLAETAGFCDHMAGAAVVGEAGQYDAAIQLAQGFQFVYSDAVHTLKQRVAAGEKQSSQRGKSEAKRS